MTSTLHAFSPTLPIQPRSFRIRTCKSVSKQRTLIAFRINTYKKYREGVVVMVNLRAPASHIFNRPPGTPISDWRFSSLPTKSFSRNLFPHNIVRKYPGCHLSPSANSQIGTPPPRSLRPCLPSLLLCFITSWLLTSRYLFVRRRIHYSRAPGGSTVNCERLTVNTLS